MSKVKQTKNIKAVPQNKQVKIKANPLKLSSTQMVLLLMVLVFTFIVYFPALKNEFTNWDDTSFVLENNSIREFSVDNSIKLFKELPQGIGVYAPLTFISFSYDYAYGQLNPYHYHLVNVVLHLLNIILVFYFIRLLFADVTIALIVAALFGVHALHVESVAWVTERKNVLYTLFFLASLISYTRYAKKGGGGFYMGALLLFLLSLFSKGMAVSLSLSVVAIDYLLGRELLSKKVILEKIPFFALSVLFGYISIASAETTNSITHNSPFSFFDNVIFACFGFTTYVAKLIIPFKLSTYYPYPAKTAAGFLPLEYYLYPLFVIAVIALFVYSFKRKPVVAFCIFFFTANVFMVLQLLPAGPNIMTDRYAYIPSIAWFILLAVGFQYVMKHKPKYSLLLKTFTVAYLLGLGVYTHARVQVWKNSGTLWTDVMTKYPQVEVAYKNRGTYYARTLQQYDSALADFNQYIKLKADDPLIYSNRGNLYGLQGKFDLAIADYNQAEKLDSNQYDVFINRSITYAKMNRFDKSLADVNKALKLRQDDPAAYFNRGHAYLQLGQYDNSIADFNLLISKDNKNPDYYFNRAVAYYNKKDYKNAMNDFTSVLGINPNHTNGFLYRSMTYNNLGQFVNAYNDALAAKKAGQQVGDDYLNQLKLKVSK